jgi:tetratricopeptide (TPR) repeat protein
MYSLAIQATLYMLRKCCYILFYLLCCSALLSQTVLRNREKCIQAKNKGYDLLYRFKPELAFEQFDTAIHYAKKMNDDILLGMTLSGSGQSLWYMSRFQEAIDSVEKAIYYLRKGKANNWEMSSALRIVSNIYDETGNYVKAFETVKEAVNLALKGDDRQNKVLSLVQLGALYNTIGDAATAMIYYKQAEELKPMRKGYPYRELHRHMGLLYAGRRSFDTAQYHYKLALPGHPSPRNIYLRIGESYLLQGRLDTAYHFLRNVYPGALELGDVPILAPTMIGLGKIYLARGQFDSALIMANNAFNLATESEGRSNIKNASLLLSDIYARRNDSTRAFFYYKRYVSLQDSLLSEQFRGQLFSFKKSAEEERQQAQLRLLKWGILLLTLMAAFIILILILRHKHEKLKLQQRSDELKMQALRAQMNPHFIFNCLSAINHFILKGQTDAASDYLTRFSRLIRLVLVNAEKNRVSLEEELDMLKLYLEMEQLRFKDAFDYHIRYDAAIQPSMIQVPSFILQPFCENAIWHGLLHKDGKGILVIDLAMKDEVMVCTITDNGIGMTKAAAMQTKIAEKQGSFGLTLTTERLALFNDDTKASGSFLIENMKDEHGNVTGTKVVLSIKNKHV